MPLHTAGGASGRERTRFAYAVFCLSKARMLGDVVFCVKIEFMQESTKLGVVINIT